jgi:hypothetical protein
MAVTTISPSALSLPTRLVRDLEAARRLTSQSSRARTRLVNTLGESVADRLVCALTSRARPGF